ncbi:MAG: hypothetical protein ACI4RM_01160 [Ruminococcus sp.]
MGKKSGHNRRLTTKNSILLLVMLVCIFLSTWAWFASGQLDANASGLSVKTENPSTLELALPNEDGSYPTEDSAYGSTLDFDKQISIIRTMVTDVTSDGLHFIIPTTTQSDGVRIVQKDQAWNRAKADSEYISIPFYVRSQTPNIYVSQYSRVNAELKDRDGNVVNKSDAANISRNGVVGAMRVSIVDMTKSISNTAYTPKTADMKFLWIPRPDLYLHTPTDSTWELKTNIQKDTELPTGGKGETYIHNYWQIRNSDEMDLPSGTGVDEISLPGAVASVYKGDDLTPTLGENKSIGNGQVYDDDTSGYVDMETITMGDKDYYVYKFVMNIWIEGSDAEARRALNNGEFDIDISFCTDTD